LASLTDVFESRLTAVADVVDVSGVRRVWDQAADAPCWTGPALWIHADLHPANVIVNDGAICGIIDFGELCAGDPAVDLSAAWKLLPSGADADFFDSYGGIEDATVCRARGWAVLSALMFITVGQAWERGLPGGQPTWGRIGHQMLKQVLV
jgi:aminoglycoside phosphotransferase (APT) family kinase protein